MKKVDLVHLTLVIMAILNGYSAVESFLTVLSYLPYLFNPTPYFAASNRAVSALIIAIMYGIACVVLVVNGRKFAGILLKDDPEGSWESTSRWDLDRRNMLFVLFIGIGLYQVTESGSVFLNDIYTIFTAKVGNDAAATVKKSYLPLNLLRLTFGALLVYAAPTFTNFIEDKIAVRLKGDKKSE